jgi:predicted ATPase/class 3 adenylate cyclase
MTVPAPSVGVKQPAPHSANQRPARGERSYCHGDQSPALGASRAARDSAGMSKLPRGTVTLLFTDIEGSTRLLQQLGRDRYVSALEAHRRLLRESFERHGGVEVEMQGDSFFFAFASARDAVAAAADGQSALASHEWESEPIRVRIGIHTGEPVIVGGLYAGLDVHRAARVMSAAHGGQVLLSQATQELLDGDVVLRDMGDHRLKDLSQPQRMHQLLIEGLRSEFPPLKTLERCPHNLPVQPNALVGREQELEEVKGLLRRDDVRLLTLTGTGGTGKTRLALQVAADLVEEFPDGVFFVSLASISDPDLVVSTIAHTLGLGEQPGQTIEESLVEYLRDKQMLLLLDNFEQIVIAAPAVADVLAAVPELRLLVTSRETLRVTTEQVYAVPPLPLPDLAEVHDAATLSQYDAVALFEERAMAAKPGFEVTNENASVIAEICLRLDGLPLAIELAAARATILPPQALLRRLDQRLTLLTGGRRDLAARQQTLRNAIGWSYDLLPDPEQALFSRLSVFVSGCQIEAAEAVCNLEGELGSDVLDGIQSLVEKSLLREKSDPDGEPRFWMLETIQEYARNSLASAGATEEMRRRHAMYFLSLAERADFESRCDPTRWFERLDADDANLLAAFHWAREVGEADLMLRLASALWGFWLARGHITEGKNALEEAVLVSGKRPARALIGLCTLRHMTGTSADAVMPDAQGALHACEQLGDDFSLAQAWNLVGKLEGSERGALEPAEYAWKQALSYADRGKYPAEKAESIWGLLLTALAGPLPAEEGIDRCKEFFDLATDNPEVRAFCQSARGALEAMRGKFSLARQLLAEGTRGFEDLGLDVWAANNAQLAFSIEMLSGDPKAASTALRKSYESLAGMGERGFLSTIAALLAHAHYAQGEYEEAEQFSRTSEDAATDNDVWSQLLWRSARAKVAARRGKFIDAVTMAREAVQIAEQTDLLNGQADVLVDLAEVLTLEGQLEEAHELLDEAARRYEQKGNLVSLRSVRPRGEGARLPANPSAQ